MGLIKDFNSATDLSLAQKQALTRQTVQKSINELFRQMVAVYRQNVHMTFDNPYNLTKEQVLAGFGNDAVELVRLATLLKDVINLAVPGTIEDPSNEYTDNSGFSTSQKSPFA